MNVNRQMDLMQFSKSQHHKNIPKKYWINIFVLFVCLFTYCSDVTSFLTCDASGGNAASKLNIFGGT